MDMYVYTRLFHYSVDPGGVKPKELSPFVGPKSKISDKLDQKLKLSGRLAVSG